MSKKNSSAIFSLNEWLAMEECLTLAEIAEKKTFLDVPLWALIKTAKEGETPAEVSVSNAHFGQEATLKDVLCTSRN